jgi:hypothetical protein
MLDTGVIGGTEPPSQAVDAASPRDRSMQVLEYLVALVAIIAAVSLAFLH